jgi:hypothetical protein
MSILPEHLATMRVLHALSAVAHATLPSHVAKSSVELSVEDARSLRILIDLIARMTAGPSSSTEAEERVALSRGAALLRSALTHYAADKKLDFDSADLISRELAVLEHCFERATPELT